MNKLEQQIADECGFKKIAGLGYTNTDLNTIRVAAKIALELAEKAFQAGREYEDTRMRSNSFSQFKQEILGGD